MGSNKENANKDKLTLSQKMSVFISNDCLKQKSE